jgi:hypothetical protein
MRMIDGMRVVDADEPVIVHITESDCERGSKKDPRRCAAALALKRNTACDESRVHVGCTYLRFGDKWLRYATPPALKAEIISFDRGGGFYPGDFRLHPLPKAQRLRPARQRTGPAKGRAETGPATARKREASRGAKKVKTEPTVFHRVKGVRQRANASETK